MPFAVGRLTAGGLVTEPLGRDTFLRLSPTEDDEEREASPDSPPGGPSSAEPIPASNDGQRELDRLVHLEMNRLRAEFAGQVRGGDYAGALRTGERIATLFPESTLAREFDSIREPLQRRAAAVHQRQADERASAV